MSDRIFVKVAELNGPELLVRTIKARIAEILANIQIAARERNHANNAFAVDCTDAGVHFGVTLREIHKREICVTVLRKVETAPGVSFPLS
jgi:tRNA(Ser,Leu) C12 N-acetylase TAN1